MLKFNESTKKKMAAINLKLVKQKGEPMKETKQLNILDNEATMTLKEITDLLDVQHSKAMKIVQNMATGHEFGAVSKLSTAYNDMGQTIETYALNKRQSIAVSAKLNTSLLMKIIDRWQELEAKVQTPKIPTLLEQTENLLISLKENEKLTLKIEQDKPKIGVFNAIANTYTDVTTTHLAKALGTTGVKLNQFLRKHDVKFMHKDFPKAKYIDWFNVINGVSDSEYSYTQTLITSTGQVEITKMWVASNPEN